MAGSGWGGAFAIGADLPGVTLRPECISPRRAWQLPNQQIYTVTYLANYKSVLPAIAFCSSNCRPSAKHRFVIAIKKLPKVLTREK